MATDRDRSIESLLRRRGIEAPQSMDQCVDAESLAAWMEGGLTAEARAAVEQHAAGCVRCQALLASMARTEIDVESKPWWRSLTAKWLVPVAAVATALVVWISVGQERAPLPAPQPSSAAASRSASPPEPAAVAPSAAPAVPPSASADAFADKPARQLAQTDPDARARQELDKLERRRQDDSRAATEQQKPAATANAVAGGIEGGIAASPRAQGQTGADAAARSAAPSPPPALPVPAPGPPLSGLQAPVAPPPPPSATATTAEAKRAAPAGIAETVTIAREAPKELAAGAGGGAGGGRGGGGGGVNGIEIRSPDPTYRWRILPATSIQRSTDGGTTWASVDPLTSATRGNSGATTVLTGGSSPSRDVCWLVGRAGVVLLSTNGATWQRRPFPETADLTSVRASSATNAVVMTADGRQFLTIDGGATWSAVK